MSFISARFTLSILVGAILALAAPTAAPALSAGTASSSPAGAKLFGVNEPNSWRSSPVRATPGQLAAQLSDLQAESQRWQLDWQAVEPNAPVNGVHSYNWSAFDSMYQADIAAGIRPLIIVSNAPKWAWPANAPTGPGSPGWGFPPGPDHLADWSAFLAALAGRYPQAAGIEIWNEPNHPAYWGRGYSSNYPDPVFYSQMLHSAYDAVKAVDPSMPVIGGALSNWQVTIGGKIAALEFAKAMFANGAAGYMDAISIHPYPQTFTPLDHTIFQLGIEQMRAARATVGASTPIWLTELGVSTTGPSAISESAQASVLADTVGWLATQPDIEAFFVHALTEPDQNAVSAEMGFALMHGSTAPFTAKPAYTALRQAVTPTLNVTLSGADPQLVSQTGAVSLTAACNQSCSLSATGTVELYRRGRFDRSYVLSGATASAVAGGSAVLTLRFPSSKLAELRKKLRDGLTAVARVTVSGSGAAGSVTRQVSFRVT